MTATRERGRDEHEREAESDCGSELRSGLSYDGDEGERLRRESEEEAESD